MSFTASTLRDTFIQNPFARQNRTLHLIEFFSRSTKRGDHYQANFRGCPFVNAVAELKEPKHAANKIAARFKEQRRTWFRDLLERLDVADPDALATQLMLLVDGAIAAALVRGDPKVARAAREAARVLLAAAGVKVSGGSAPTKLRERRHSADR